jgi:hypothetical protein
MANENELNHPNNGLWQKQREKRYKEIFPLLKENISDLTIDEIIDQKNYLLEMQHLLNRIGKLKGLSGVE